MIPDERPTMWQSCLGSAIGFALGLIVCLLLTLCCSCTRTIYNTREVPVYTRDTIVRVLQLHDSVTTTDSVYIHAVGDTIWRERWRTAYRWRTRTDTLRVSTSVPVVLHDTIASVREVEVPVVEYRQRWWQRLLAWVGGLTIAGGAIGTAIKFRKI